LVTHESQAAIVGNVQPFVGVGSPGIRVSDSFSEMGAGRGRGGPETERAIDVDPRSGPMSDSTNFRDRIERSGVHVAGLDTNDGGAGDRRELIGQHSTLLIDWNFDDTAPAKAKQA